MDDDGNRKIDLVEFKRGLRDYGGKVLLNCILICYNYTFFHNFHPFFSLFFSLKKPLAGSFLVEKTKGMERL